VRKRRLKRGRADAGVVAKQKRKIFLPGEVFFFLTCPLMGDPIHYSGTRGPKTEEKSRKADFSVQQESRTDLTQIKGFKPEALLFGLTKYYDL
jgi:hypothetical protein